MLRRVFPTITKAIRPISSPIASQRGLMDISENLLGLDEDRAELQSAIRRWAQATIAPIAGDIDKNGDFPSELWTQMGELGILGMTAPAEYGGSALSYWDHVIAMEEVSRASASVALSYGAHSNLCVNQIVRNGNEEQKQKYLPSLISGETVGALAMSESCAGSDPLSMRLRAEKKGSSYVLNGSKTWITNGPMAGTLIVYARSNPDPTCRPADAITAFLVEKGMKGYSTGPKFSKLGMRGSSTCELFFDDCEVPEENVLGEVGQGARVLMSGLDSERLVLSGGPLGIMAACMDVVLPYVHERKQFGKPIGTFQLMQGKLGDMYTRMSAARAYVYQIARAASDGKIEPRHLRKDCAAAILYSSESATAIALEAIQALGGNGYTAEFPVERYLRDAKLYEIGAGTNEIRRFLIGRELYDD